MKFNIPVDHSEQKDDDIRGVPGVYFDRGMGVGPGPVMGMDVDLEFLVNAPMSDAMGLIIAGTRELEEYLQNDLNCAVMNVTSSQGLGGSVYQVGAMGGGRSAYFPGHVSSPTVSMKIVTDPLITDVVMFRLLLDKFLTARNMVLTNISFSQSSQDVLYGTGRYAAGTKAKPVKYVPTPVRCSDCHEEFLHTELKAENALWGEGDYERNVESDTVCPKCGSWDCCELKFAGK